MYNLLIKNGKIVTSEETLVNTDILIDGGKISEVMPNINIDGYYTIDATDKIIIPGLIDMHCDICEPGYEYRESLVTASLSAARGGFTSITCSPNTLPSIDNKTVVEYIKTKSEIDAVTHLFPYGSLTKKCKGTELTEYGEMQLSGIVALSDGDVPIQDNSVVKKIFRYASMFDMPIIMHCEDTSISNKSGINEGYMATKLGLKGFPVVAETIQLARNIFLAKEYGINLHITHVSSKESVELIRLAKDKGISITAETSPRYFILDESNVDNYNTYAKISPPLRTKEDIEGIINGLKDGTIDVISSDHKPNTIDSKLLEYDIASFGMSTFETAFKLSYTYLVHNGILTLQELVNKMSYNPANILGINKGKITPGYDADLVMIDINSKDVINSKKFLSKAKYSVYDGYETQVDITNTIIQGNHYNYNED
ncbi:dihydroorotase [Vallitalea guaymasensis]|uniref:dihydroorotase n=1 Tax=Vallitalea guaymasensis TaxID=1185412 RepID=UPI000DE3812C|nr:dihydroorotase [Vallitalea guaymasensis]